MGRPLGSKTRKLKTSPAGEQIAAPVAETGAAVSSESEPVLGRQNIGVTSKETDKRINRLSLPLDDAGRIDWSTVRESRRAEVRETLKNDPSVAALFSKSDFGGGLEFTEDHARVFLDTFSIIEQQAFRVILKLEPAALRAFQFNADHHAILDPQLVAIGNKYSDRLPDWMLRYKEEILFGASLAKIVTGQVLLARAIHAQTQQARMDAARGPVSVSVPSNGHDREAELISR